MTEQTFVAVYDMASNADAAMRDLEAAHVPSSAISRHAKDATSGTAAASGATADGTPAQEVGLWASLFGGVNNDASMYGRSVESGSTVVTVRVPDDFAPRVSEILERHDPVDLDERAASYGSAIAPRTTSSPTTEAAMADTGGGIRTASASHDGVIRLAAEQLTVGKRAVSRGGTRVRSYVVETPVEEQVTLRDETVTVERRPVAGAQPVPADAFTEKVLEAQEIDEEAVVGKTARVVEEVSLHKEVTERVETVRDTVRHQEVEVEQMPGTAGSIDTVGTAGTTRPASRDPTR